MHLALEEQGPRTFEAYVCVWILLDSFEIILVVVLVRGLHNVAVGIVSRRVALQDVPVVAGMLYALWAASSV
jgi:hypothetical protein